jgi:AAA15 family ATPase/GTPase
MKLKTFEIDSYRSCLKTRLILDDKLTCLIGINGSGKSNILNALVLLKKIFMSTSQTKDDKSISKSKCKISAEIEYQGKTLFVKGIIIYDTDDRNSDDVYNANLSFNFREFVDYTKWVKIPVQFLVHPQIFSKGELKMNRQMLFRIFSVKDIEGFQIIAKSTKLRRLISQVSDFFTGISYYSASQFSDPSRCPVSLELEEERPLRRIRNVSHELFILDLYKSFKANNTQFKRYISTINEQGIGLVDGIEFDEFDMPSSSYEVRVGGKIKKIERSRLLVVPKLKLNGIDLSPNQLSEGTFKTLALIFYILNDESKLLLIEEPEVCVHHGLLDSIVSLVKSQSQRKQIVMSTHSDFVLDHLSPDNLVLIRWIQGRGTTATPLTNSMSTNDYIALKDYLKQSGNLGEYIKEGGLVNG